MAEFDRLEERLELQGWRFAGIAQCGHGHDEGLWDNHDFPGVFMRRSCCGDLEYVTGHFTGSRRGVVTFHELYNFI